MGRICNLHHRIQSQSTGSALLWLASIIAHCFALPVAIIVGAFVLGCFVACYEAVRLLN
jgi:uncharacterized membrane protein